MQKLKLKVGFTILLTTVNIFAYAQNPTIDSLRSLLKHDKIDSIRVNHLIDISWELQYSNPDSSIIFANQALDILSNSKNIPESKRQLGIGACFHQLGQFYRLIGDYRRSLDFDFKALAMWDKLEVEAESKNKSQFLIRKAKTLGNIGVIYDEHKDYQKALDYYFKALRIDEKLARKKGIATKLGNIGLVYKNQAASKPITLANKIIIDSLYRKALNYYFKALKIDKEIGNQINIEIWLGNIGVVYDEQKDYNKALNYYFMALKIAEQLDDKSGVARQSNNIGLLYTNQKRYKEAYDYIYRSFVLTSSIGELFDLQDVYLSLGNLYEKSDIPLADSLGGKLGTNEQMRLRSLYYYRQYIAIHDTLFSNDSKKHLVQIEMNYEFDKKEMITKAENKRQRIMIWSVVLGLIFVLFFAGYIFRSLHITRIQKNTIEEQKQLVDAKNEILNQQNEEISSQRDEIEAQRDEIEAQRDTVTVQKEIIEVIHKKVSDSIIYAKRIQEAVLPSSKYADTILNDHFILFKPKDVVSGDFYWATKINEWLIFAVADCTGHGVPGAFMSMLGISFLNEIVRKKEILQASEVLEQLRFSVIEALKQSFEVGRPKDGMDIALCILNLNTHEMQFAGANNSIFVLSGDTKELAEIEADRITVAISHNIKPFTNHIIQLQKGDIIYLATDGYEDQFGGIENKKFQKVKIKQLLVENQNKPLLKQKEILDNIIEAWMNCNEKKIEQTDDITIMGIKIS